jgi:hypothetical protein
MYALWQTHVRWKPDSLGAVIDKNGANGHIGIS